MMKLHGKDYKFSPVKMYLPDVSYEQWLELTEFYKQPDNVHTLVLILNHCYAGMLQYKKALKEKQDEKDKQVGTEGGATSDPSSEQSPNL